MGITISSMDALRQSVEAASGGANTVLYDDKGNPSVMVIVPAFNIEDVIGDSSLGTGLHPAFIVNGTPKRELFIGKYQATVRDSRAYAWPGVDLQTSINFDTANARCTAKGAGWHMMTNAEWAAVAMWSHKHGAEVQGNTNWGRDHVARHETGRRVDSAAPGLASGTGRTLAGSGPASWSHDGTLSGIMDLCGNVWEWVRGHRLVNGEIQIIADNDAAVTGADHGAGSPLWRALLPNGTLVAPGTADTLKWNASGANGAGSPILATTVTSQSNGSTSASQQYNAVSAAGGVSVPPILKLLGLYPHVTDMARGRLYANNDGERLPVRGGHWGGGAVAGLFSLNLGSARSDSGAAVGFRPAFAL